MGRAFHGCQWKKGGKEESKKKQRLTNELAKFISDFISWWGGLIYGTTFVYMYAMDSVTDWFAEYVYIYIYDSAEMSRHIICLINIIITIIIICWVILVGRVPRVDTWRFILFGDESLQGI